MASLADLRAQVASVFDYDPSLQTWKDDVDRHLNAALLDLWGMRPWTFATAEVWQDMPAPITNARDGVNANVAKGRRYVSFSADIPRLDRTWEGQPIFIQGYEYTISRVKSRNHIELDQQFLGTSDTGDTTFEARFRHFHLPHDALDLLDITHVKGDVETALGQEQHAMLPGTGTAKTGGVPTLVVVETPTVVPPAEDLTIAATDAGHTEGFPTGNLEVAWAFDKAGRVGPLSKPKTINLGTPTNSWQLDLTFTTLQGKQVAAGTGYDYDTGPVEWEALRKRIFFNANFSDTTGTRMGLPLWIEAINAGPAASRNTDPDWMQPIVVADTSATATVQYLASFTPDRARIYRGSAHHVRYRLWPEPDLVDWSIPGQAAGTFNEVVANYYARLRVRYIRRPAPLAGDTDVPELPPDMHPLLVYLAVSNIAQAKGDDKTAAHYASLFERLLPRAEARWVARSGIRLVRGAGGLFGTTRGGWGFRPEPPLVKV